jgi:ElaB/YqjD/DUF883 family membrane-anchored ribosome-binding protein
MATQLDDISEAIGQLRADVRHLGVKFDTAERNLVETTKRADEHRSTIHRRVDDLIEEVGTIKSKVAVIDDTVQDAKQVTDEVKLWKQRGIGALAVAGIAGSAVGATVVGFVAYWWDAILRALRAA